MSRVADLTWIDVRDALERGAPAILPVGAAAKQHGLHLPMSTDQLTAEAMAARVAERVDGLAWPTVGYGHYPAFLDYPGSTSLPADVFSGVIEALLRDLVRAGAQRILILNTGISTIRPIEHARELVDADITVAHLYRGERYLATKRAVCTQERGEHADEAETSVMLHLHPERVNLAKARVWTTPVQPGRWTPTDPSSPSYSPQGVFGDPTHATAAKGAHLLEAMLEDTLRILGHRDGVYL
ncbi:MAG: creatininase family protein [Sandaracinaceae bacterium]